VDPGNAVIERDWTREDCDARISKLLRRCDDVIDKETGTGPVVKCCQLAT
jgi:hypothetical protein